MRLLGAWWSRRHHTGGGPPAPRRSPLRGGRFAAEQAAATGARAMADEPASPTVDQGRTAPMPPRADPSPMLSASGDRA